MRSFFIFLSKSKWMKNIFTRWSYAWKIASRFVAGTSLDEAIEIVKQLNQEGFVATLDHLGEQTDSLEAASAATHEIMNLIKAIHAHGVQSNVSIKLSQIGLNLNVDFCRRNLFQIVDIAKATNNFIRIDMEDSSLTDVTIEMVMWARTFYEGVGIVIQSYLFRSEEDVKNMLENGITMRIVKGAYQEPYSIAFRQKKDVDINFDQLVHQIFEHPTARSYKPTQPGVFPSYAALGTHDDDRIQYGINLAHSLQLTKDQMEIQMLYGIRRDLQAKYVISEFPVRIYIPYGTHWFPYFMRRLAERPANVWFFISNFFR